MSNLYIGTSKLKNLYVGTLKAKKIYMGITMVWQSAIPVAKPTQLSPSGTYSGSTITNGYTMPSGVTMTGSASGINAGTYTAVYTPDADHIWSDTEDRTPVTVTLTIGRASVGAKPATAITKSYTGSAQNNGYTKPTGVNVTGNTSGTNGGTYSATYTPDSNHKWSDGTTTAVTRVLTIQYVWNKYNSVSSYVARTTSKAANSRLWETTTVSYSGYYYYIVYNSATPSFNTSNGKYTLPSGGSSSHLETGTGGYMTSVGTAAFTQPQASTPAPSTVPSYARLDAGGAVMRIRTNIARVGSANYVEVLNAAKYYDSTLTYSKGSTSYGSVANTTNSSAYPANGRHSDGYWYVKTW